MTQAAAIRTTLITSFTLLLCNSIVCAQAVVLTVGENGSMPENESESITMSTYLMSAEKKVDKSSRAKKQQGSAIPQTRPGERVSNPAHEILNFDTTLGGVEVTGTSPTDFGYAGPGDMRTHLWNGHSNELIANGITEHRLMAMNVAEVQKWHNHFHGAEGSPEHLPDDGEQSHLDTIVQQPTLTPSPTHVDDAFYGTIVYGNSGYNNSEYPQPVYGQPRIIHNQGVIIQGSTLFEFETQMQPAVLNQGVIQSSPSVNHYIGQ